MRTVAAAPRAEPLCGRVAALVSVNDFADRPARALSTAICGRAPVRA